MLIVFIKYYNLHHVLHLAANYYAWYFLHIVYSFKLKWFDFRWTYNIYVFLQLIHPCYDVLVLSAVLAWA